jgi:hypothetical protein
MNQQGRRIPPNPAAIIKVQSFIRRRLAGLTLEKLALHQRQRTRVCYEILETEKSYVKYLEQLGKFYLQPLIDAGHVKKQEHLKLFNMVDDVRKINLFILAELEKRMGNWERLLTRDQRIGDIFAKLSPFLKIYSDYVSEYQSNLSEVNRLFDKKSSFLKKCMDKVPADYDQLQTAQFLLIMPVQRIPRYQLLVAELLKHTQYEHSDYAELTKALDAIKAAGSKVEEVVKERQSIEKIVEINKKVIRPSKRDLPDSFVDLGRSYVYEGSLMKVSHKSNQERYIFLFSDSILYTKQISSSEYEGRFFTTLTGTSITDLPDTAFVEIQNRISIQTPKKSVIVYTKTPAEKKTWLEQLRGAIAMHEKSVTNANNRRKSVNARPSMLMSNDDVKDALRLNLSPRSNVSSPSDSPRDFPPRSPSAENQLMQRSPSSPNMQRALALSLGNQRKSISNGNSPAVQPKFNTVQARRNIKRAQLPADSQWHSDEPSSTTSLTSQSSESPRSGEESPRKHSPRSDSGSLRSSNGIVVKTASPSSSPPGPSHKLPPRPPPRLSVSVPMEAQAVATPPLASPKQTPASLQQHVPAVPPLRTQLTGSNNFIPPSSPKTSGEFSPRPIPNSAQPKANHDGPMAVGLNTPPMPPRRDSVGPNGVPPQRLPKGFQSPVAGAKKSMAGNQSPALSSAIGNTSPRAPLPKLSQSTSAVPPPSPPKKNVVQSPKAKAPLAKAPLAKAPMPKEPVNSGPNATFAVPAIPPKKMAMPPSGFSPKLMQRGPVSEPQMQQRPLAKSVGTQSMNHARLGSVSGPPPVPAAPPKRTQVTN